MINTRSAEDIPAEVWLNIFKFNSDDEIKNTFSRVNQNWNAIISEHFFETLYGNSLRYLSWQANEKKDLKMQMNVLIKNHQVTIFNQPQVENRILRYAKVGGRGAAFLVGVAYSITKPLELYLKYKESKSKNARIVSVNAANYSSATTTQCVLFSITLLLSFIIGSLWIFRMLGFFSGVANRDNRNYQNLPPSNQLIRDTQKLKDRFPYLNDPALTLNKLPVGFTTSQLINAILKSHEESSKHADRLATTLKETRFSGYTTLALDKILEESRFYAKTSICLWQAQKNCKGTILKDSQNEPKICKTGSLALK